MGFGPDQVDRWEPYQIVAVYRGYKRAHTPPKTKAPSDDQIAAAMARHVVH